MALNVPKWSYSERHDALGKMWVTRMGKRLLAAKGWGFFTQCWLKVTGEMNSNDVAWT